MNARVEIQRRRTTKEGFAPVHLIDGSGNKLCELDLQYSKLAPLRNRTAAATDFLIIASAVYVLDKLVDRNKTIDCWTRTVSLQIPVSDVTIWNAVKSDLEGCVSFLTGDLWHFEFTARECNPIRPVRKSSRVSGRIMPLPSANIICLFSGGLDSLVGAIDWLESNTVGTILLIGHHDGQISGPFSDQRTLLEKLKHRYPGRIKSIFMRVGHSGESIEDTEITLRGRSLLFISLGIYAASALGTELPLLIPENGTISVNIPLTPSRRGSCSTRTAHPHYLNMLDRVLFGIGITNDILNPMADKTKGEVVSQCLNRSFLGTIAQYSVSCAKRGHKIHWTHRNANGCGRCMPCIYRRAALHTIDIDTELYGDDFCRGEISLNYDGEKANDLRACFSFLRQNLRHEEISLRLMANGSLDYQSLPSYADLILRAMEEIKTLLRDKGTSTIRLQSGV